MSVLLSGNSSFSLAVGSGFPPDTFTFSVEGLPPILKSHSLPSVDMPSNRQFLNASDFSSPAKQATFFKIEDGQTHKSQDVRSLFSDYKGDDKELVVFVLPHDDDGVIGAGLTLVNLIKAGVPVAIIVATDGRSGHSTERDRANIVKTRVQEALESARILGINVDDGLSDTQRSLRKLVKKCLPVTARIFSEKVQHKLFDYAHENHGMIRFLEIPDGSSTSKLGKQFEQKLVAALRKGFCFDGEDRQPTRIIYPTGNDAHLDHQNLAKELLISVFHSEGSIWSDVAGFEPLKMRPQFIEMLVYCELPNSKMPDLLVHATAEDQAKIIRALQVYRSQLANIRSMEKRVNDYPYEYLSSATPPLFDEKVRARYMARFTTTPLI